MKHIEIQITLNATAFATLDDLIETAVKEHIQTLMYLGPNDEDSKRLRVAALQGITDIADLARQIGRTGADS